MMENLKTIHDFHNNDFYEKDGCKKEHQNESAVEEEAPLYLLQAPDTLKKEKVQEWVDEYDLCRYLAEFRRKCTKGCETYFDEDNTLFVKYGERDGNKRSVWAMSIGLQQNFGELCLSFVNILMLLYKNKV